MNLHFLFVESLYGPETHEFTVCCEILNISIIITNEALLVSAAALHACLRGSFSSGCSHLPLPPLKSGDPLHFLPGRLHHPPFPEPCDLWFSGWALQEVLGPVPGLLEYRPGQTGVTESEPVGEITNIRLPQVQLAASQCGLQTDVSMVTSVGTMDSFF